MQCCFNEISHLPAPLGLAARDRSARRALQDRDDGGLCERILSCR
jgi:hypothetical protein